MFFKKKKEMKQIHKAVKCRIYPSEEEKAFIEMCFAACRTVWNECVALYNDIVDTQVLYGWPARWPKKETYPAGKRGPRPFPDKFAPGPDGKLRPIVSKMEVRRIFRDQLLTRHLRGAGKGRPEDALPGRFAGLSKSTYVPTGILNKVIEDDFERAIDKYLSKGGKPPRFKSRFDNQSFGVEGKALWLDPLTRSFTWPKKNSVFISKKLFQAEDALPDDAIITSVRFTKNKLGEYYCSVAYKLEAEHPDPREADGRSDSTWGFATGLP